MKFQIFQKLATAACAIAAIYLLSILVTGGYEVDLPGIKFGAVKLWPAIGAMLGFALVPGRAITALARRSTLCINPPRDGKVRGTRKWN